MASTITISQIQSADIATWKKEDYEKYLPQMIKKYNDRVRSFSNAKNKNVFSYAIDKMEDWLNNNTYAKAARGTLKMPNPTGDNRRDFARREVIAYRIQEFFRAETSSVSGARRVARDQDARLFGVNARGNPVRRMTFEERQRFWAVYDEFLNQNKEWSDKSYRAQEVIASMVEDGTIEKVGKVGKYYSGMQEVLENARRRYQAGLDEEDFSPWYGEKAPESVKKKYADTILKRGRHGR